MTTEDTLYSIERVRIIDAVCEGEIEGLVGGLAGVYLDDVPVQHGDDGTEAFKNLTIESRTGTRTQDRISWQKGTESTTSVGVEVNTLSTVERVIIDPNADAVRVGVSVQQLYSQGADGSIVGAQVQYAIALKSSGGSFVDQPIQFDWVSIPGSGRGFTMGTSSALCGRLRGTIRAATAIAKWAGKQWVDLSAKVQYCPSGTGAWVDATTVKRRAIRRDAVVSWTEGKSKTEWVDIIGSFDVQVTLGQAYDVRVVVVSGPSDLAVYFAPAQELQRHLYGTISGKTMTAYKKTHAVTLPPGGAPWTIQMRRITPDSTSSLVQNKCYFADLTTIYEEKLNYPNTAVVGLEFDARQFSSIPRRAYRMRLLKIDIPSNYDPITREYSGEWDGTFKRAWCNNPAWVFYDLATHSRYGTGDRITRSMLDKWTLYEIGQYCDELVPDGMGGLEPRFTCNLYLQTREDAVRVLSNLAAIFRGMVFWSASGIWVSQDAPKATSYIFTNANVIGGKFTYAGTSLRARHNTVSVAWLDPGEMYRQKLEYCSDPELISRWGYVQQADIVALGCTSRSMAHRVGDWYLYTERYESDTVTFDTGLEGAIPKPGNVIEIADTNKAGARIGGRIIATPTSTTVTLDKAVTLASGQTYSLTVINDLGGLETRTVTTAAGTTASLTISAAWTNSLSPMSLWVLTCAALTTQTFRVISVVEKEQGMQFTVSAVAYNASKFTYVDAGIALQERDTSALTNPGVSPEPPTGLVVSDSIFVDSSKAIRSKMSLSWIPSSSGYVRGYAVMVRAAADGSWQELQETKSAGVDILDTTDGAAYELRVYAVNSFGLRSTGYAGATYTPQGKTRPPGDVSGCSGAFDDAGLITISWSPTNDLDLDGYEIRSGADWASGAKVFYGQTHNAPPIAPAPGSLLSYWVCARDVFGYYSANPTPVAIAVTPPSQPAVLAEVIDNNVLLRWSDARQTLPIATHEIRRGATWATATSIGTKSGRFTTIFETQGGQFTYWVAAIDTAGNVGTPGSALATVANPPAYVRQYDQVASWETLSNALVESATSAVLPINTTETFAAHFTANAWASPQDQINAGFPLYMQPNPASGFVEDVVDVGVTLASSKVSLTYSADTITGSPVVVPKISVSNASASGPWIDYPGVTSVFATTFRWAKIRVDVSGGVVRIRDASVRMEVKERTESGTTAAVSTDVGGTLVTFSTPFSSIKSVVLSPQGSTARSTAWDMTPGDYSKMTVYIFDQAGARASGNVGWSVTGV